MSDGAIQYLIHPLGLPLRVMQWGAGGPTVLLVHGLGSHAEAWARVARRLAPLGLRCIAIDTPGHGLSWKGAGFDYTAAGHARLIEAVCDAIGADEIDLVGSSLGGLHAAAFASRRPERLRTLALIGSVGLREMPPERRRWTATYLADMSRAAIRERLHRGVFSPAVFSESYVEETYRMNNSAGAAESFAAIARYYEAGINADIQTEALARLGPALPILLLWGKDDPTVAYDIAVEAAGRIPGATLVGIAGTRHIPHMERPEISVAALARHIARRSPIAAPEHRPGNDDPAVETIGGGRSIDRDDDSIHNINLTAG